MKRRIIGATAVSVALLLGVEALDDDIAATTEERIETARCVSDIETGNAPATGEALTPDEYQSFGQLAAARAEACAQSDNDPAKAREWLASQGY